MRSSNYWSSSNAGNNYAWYIDGDGLKNNTQLLIFDILI